MPMPNTDQEIASDLRSAVYARRVLSRDLEFVRSLVAANDRGRWSDRQREYARRMWSRWCDTSPLPQDVHDGITMILAALPAMTPDRRGFAEAMIEMQRYRTPSDAQERAFRDLVAALRVGTPTVAGDATTDPVLPNAQTLFRMFDAASARADGLGRNRTPRLSFPGLSVWRGRDGFIYVTRPHADPVRRTRFARIAPDGRLLGGFPSRGPMLSPEQVDLLTRLAANPEETLAAEGRRTGTCCMCARGLTDPRSVNLGMGPVCAARWGLSGAWADAGTAPSRAVRGRTATFVTQDEAGTLPADVTLRDVVTDPLGTALRAPGMTFDEAVRVIGERQAERDRVAAPARPWDLVAVSAVNRCRAVHNIEPLQDDGSGLVPRPARGEPGWMLPGGLENIDGEA